MSDAVPLPAPPVRSAALIGLGSGGAAAFSLLAGGVSAGPALALALIPAVTAFALTLAVFRRPVPAAVVPAAPPPPPVAPNDLDTPVLGVDVIERFPLPLLVTGEQEMLLAASASARRVFPALAIGRPISLVLRDPDSITALAAAGHIDPVTSTGSLPFRILCVFEDLTEQRATERMRVDFVANASHELRTPLASLLGFIETLQGPARDDPKARERFLAIMREQAGRMARLIDDLLSLSRAELRAHQQPVTPINLTGIVREIIDSLSLSASERGVTFKADLPETPAMIRGDRDDLLRLVENLVENAIRYGREGKTVDIAIARRPSGEIELSVRDHGPGIAPEHLPRLTERFYRADISHSREIGGTGLGLAIVKHLVARHRGRLDIESRLGEGARFAIILPPAD
jgi:two-component system, OmpR family, phosphate regulon sensor histidine kinase PhoR